MQRFCIGGLALATARSSDAAGTRLLPRSEVKSKLHTRGMLFAGKKWLFDPEQPQANRQAPVI
ncbi:hypothetical protein EGK14_16760 [Erwinia sp. 198]|nr:hypothetical protein EGK14_16760 [Erwinia sp. 198]